MKCGIRITRVWASLNQVEADWLRTSYRLKLVHIAPNMATHIALNLRDLSRPGRIRPHYRDSSKSKYYRERLTAE